MNTIEQEDAPERAPGDAHQPQRNGKQSPPIPRQDHIFGRLPVEGLTDALAHKLARADIAGIRLIADPDDRRLPLAFMAFNMTDSEPYHSALREIAPEIEKEVRTIALPDVQQRTGLLTGDFPHLVPQAISSKNHEDRMTEELDGRMAQLNLQDLGWRDRSGLNDVLRDLERLAATSLQKAGALWDKYRPGDSDKPIFIDGDDTQPKVKGFTKLEPSIGPITPPPIDSDVGQRSALDVVSGKEKVAHLPALHKRYIIADNRYYFRADQNKLAFEDLGKRLSTEHDDANVVKSMVALAAEKQWNAIKVNGTDEFKRQAWLAASLRDMNVSGYVPSDIDRARLEELRTAGPARSINTIDREISRPSSARDESSEPPPNSGKPLPQVPTKPEKQLTPQQRVAVDTLKAILTARGDSETAIKMAESMAIDRFRNKRVYVGKLLEHGSAPYGHEPGKNPSYYVKLNTASGEKTVWGVDLPRALAEGGIDAGDEVAVVVQGRKRVTVKSKDATVAGSANDKEANVIADRNRWDISRLDRMRDEVKSRLVHEVVSESLQPVVKYYDRSAPRNPTEKPARRSKGAHDRPDAAGIMSDKRAPAVQR